MLRNPSFECASQLSFGNTENRQLGGRAILISERGEVKPLVLLNRLVSHYLQKAMFEMGSSSGSV